MKKIYAFAAAALAALSMNAQLYVCGNGSNMGWNPAEPLTVALTDGVYKFVGEGVSEFKISTAMGDWDTFNAAALYCNYTEADLGTAVELTAGAGNINTPWSGDYTITVSSDFKTITMTTDTPKPSGPVDMYIRGGMNDWNAEDAWKFVYTGENTYELACSIAAGVEFKIADANWGAINFTYSGMVDLNDEVLFTKGSNINTTLAEDFDGVVKVEYITGDTEMAVEFVTGEGVSDVLVDSAAAEYFNLQGVRVQNPENGLFIVRQGNKVTKVVK